VGPGNETFSSCAARSRYDNTNSNKTIALLDVNGTLAADACCSVSVEDRAALTPREYVCDTHISSWLVRPYPLHPCTQAVYPLGATCGNTTANATMPMRFPSLSCSNGLEFNSSRSEVPIDGDFKPQAAAKCCVYAEGATCGNVDGSPFPTSDCVAGGVYNESLSSTPIAGDVVAQAAAKCCSSIAVFAL
jgi:hypothetical protein